MLTKIIIALASMVAVCAADHVVGATNSITSSNLLVDVQSFGTNVFTVDYGYSTNWIQISKAMRQLSITQDDGEFSPVVIYSEIATNRWTNNLPEAGRQVEVSVVRRHWRLKSVNYENLTNIVELGSAVVSSSARTITNSGFISVRGLIVTNYIGRSPYDLSTESKSAHELKSRSGGDSQR